MSTYTYQALDQSGKRRKGSLESESQAKAFAQLQAQGLTPVQLSKIQAKTHRTRQFFPKVWMRLTGHNRIRMEEAFYYLGLMLQGGNSLTQGLELLGRMGQDRSANVWQDIRDKVESGISFSQALQEYPQSFSRVSIGMIQVAERTGHLGSILEQIAAYEEQRKEMQSKLLTAMAYPLVVLLIGVGAVTFLLAGILPRIAGIFQASGQDMPVYTRFLLGLSQWLGDWGSALFLLFLLCVFWAGWAYRTKNTLRYRVDKLLWKIPIFRDSTLARFSGLLAFQLAAGISLVQAMQGAVQGVRSFFFRERMSQAAKEVAAGQALDQVLLKMDFVPQMYLTALGSGQKAGELPAFLERLHRILEHRVDTTLRRIIGLLEPMLILVLGLVIGFFVLAVMEPIFDLTSRIS